MAYDHNTTLVPTAIIPSINFTFCYSLSSIVFVWDDVPNAVSYDVLYNDGSGYTVNITDSEVLIDPDIVCLCYGESFSVTVTALDASDNVICTGTTTCNFDCPAPSNISFTFTPNQTSFCIDATGVHESELNVTVTALGNSGVDLFLADCNETSTWTLSNGDSPTVAKLDSAAFDLSNVPSGIYTIDYDLAIPNCTQQYSGSFAIEINQLPFTPPVTLDICEGETVYLLDELIISDPQPDSIIFYSAGVPPFLDPADIIDPPVVSPTAALFCYAELYYPVCTEPSYSLVVLYPNQIVDNFFLGNSTLWNNPNNWSIGLVPTKCNNVIIPAGNTVELLSGQAGICNTILVDPNATFIVHPNATFDAVAEY